ncbi:MAG: hypothetical protein ACI9F9_001803 [Candidatus Paceibacteria bacterium]|jgi:hypothetical protein
MTTIKPLLLAAATLATASFATAQGDMIVHRMGFSGSNGNSMSSYGVASGIAAYSVASQSCNIGDQNLIWTSGDGTTHPVISQNVFRHQGRRFEHVGQSWLKHGFCALCESGCGSGVGSGCANVLRVGCADTYGSSLNDGKNGGPKYTVDPVSGNHQHPDPSPVGNETTRGRLQISVPDVDPAQNAGAQYYVEGAYMHYEDHQLGNGGNNATWRKIKFANNASFTMTGDGVNHPQETIVYAWKDADNAVVIQDVNVMNEGGANIHGYMQVASRVWDNGDGTWEYEYLIYNQSSTQGVQSFSIPYAGGATISNVWFNDVDYHSGEPQDGTDWNMAEGASDLTWTCPETFAQNPNGNAINWGTGYTFGFVANAGPAAGTGSVDMFEPGVGNTLTFPLEGPGGGGTPPVGTAYCFGDGSSAACPCFGYGGTGEGCMNTSGNGATLSADGMALFSNDTLSLSIVGVPGSKPGLILRGDNQIASPAGDGILCTAGGSQRSHVQMTAGGATTFTDFNGSGFGSVANVGSATNFQFWYRDPAATCSGAGFNFTNGMSVDYLP